MSSSRRREERSDDTSAKPLARRRTRRTTLKDLARTLDLSPATVSRALAGPPQSRLLAEETHDRVLEAARRLDYRPNALAQSLKGKRTYSVGVIVPEISEGYTAGLISGIELRLDQHGYFYYMVSHRSRSEQVMECLRRLEDRGAEGFIVIAGRLGSVPPLPTVVISGHRHVEGTTGVWMDEDQATLLALTHLHELGHRQIAFFRGSPGNVGTEVRWRGVEAAAAALGLEVLPELTLQLSGESYGETFTDEAGGYHDGYELGRRLVEGGHRFTALCAFNDISAIGAMLAFRQAGLSVPNDVSVVGFDDIQVAAFHNPSLTTVRQPLVEMGERAAEILVRRLSEDSSLDDEDVAVRPVLVVRESTARRRVE